MKRFPIPATEAYTYSDDYGAGRNHQGIDIFAPRGTPVVAVDAGTARAAIDPKGGNVVYLNGANGSRYYYAHLNAWAPKLEGARTIGVRVAAGELLGELGNTGNASGTSPHLHFQLWTADGIVDPFAYLQQADPFTGVAHIKEPRPKRPEPTTDPPHETPKGRRSPVLVVALAGAVLVAVRVRRS